MAGMKRKKKTETDEERGDQLVRKPQRTER